MNHEAGTPHFGGEFRAPTFTVGKVVGNQTIRARLGVALMCRWTQDRLAYETIRSWHPDRSKLRTFAPVERRALRKAENGHAKNLV